MMTSLASLRIWADVWDNTSVLAAIFVFVGVVLESVTDFEVLASLVGLVDRVSMRAKVARLGLLILIVALAVEVVAAIGSHKVNAQITTILNKQLDDTIKHDLELTKLTAALELSNRQLRAKIIEQEQLLRNVVERSNKFDKVIRTQQERADIAIRSLNQEEMRLDVARKEVLKHATASASAAALASRTANNMTATLAAEQQMHSRMRQFVTPRELSHAQVVALTESLRNFPNTQFDLLVANDPDSTNLLQQLTEILQAAGWVWKDAPSLGDINWTITGKPKVGLITKQGIYIEIAGSQLSKLEKPTLALVNGLLTAGIPVSQPIAAPDEKMDPRFEKSSIHIIIGTR